MFFKLETRNFHHKTKQNDTCCAVAMTTVSVLVLPKLKLSFCLNQGPSTPANLMMRVKTIWKPCSEQVPLSHSKGVNWGFWFLTERDWSQESFYGNDTIFSIGQHTLFTQFSTNHIVRLIFCLNQKIGKAHWKGSTVNYYFILLYDVHFCFVGT